MCDAENCPHIAGPPTRQQATPTRPRIVTRHPLYAPLGQDARGRQTSLDRGNQRLRIIANGAILSPQDEGSCFHCFSTSNVTLKETRWRLHLALFGQSAYPRRANCTMPDFTDRLRPAHDGTAALQAERDGSLIDVSQLARHLLGRDGFLERQEKVLAVLRKERLFNKGQQLNLSRPERYHVGLARAKAIQRLIRQEGWDSQDYHMAEYLNDEMSPYFLHMSMFSECYLVESICHAGLCYRGV